VATPLAGRIRSANYAHFFAIGRKRPGIRAASSLVMARTDDKKPSSYDDIVRRTVVDPDSSVRPSKDQEQQAREGFRAMDDHEHALHDRVQQALAHTGVTGVTIEVARERVTLRGTVSDVALLRTIEDAVARVPGVDTVHNQVVVSAS
jgi:hypothetical protein